VFGLKSDEPRLRLASSGSAVTTGNAVLGENGSDLGMASRERAIERVAEDDVSAREGAEAGSSTVSGRYVRRPGPGARMRLPADAMLHSSKDGCCGIYILIRFVDRNPDRATVCKGHSVGPS
jgi:hypothetical protein